MPEDRRIEPIILDRLPDLATGKDVQNFIITLPPRERRGPHWAVILLFLALILGVVSIVWVSYNYVVMQDYLKMVTGLDSHLQTIARPAPIHYPAGTSAHFPPSQTLRLMGTINDGKVQYIAQTLNNAGVYVTIPAKDCRVLSGSPVCHYQGRSVTRFTG